MLYDAYSDRVHNKLKDLCKLYAGMMYKKCDSLFPLSYLETKEHFRTVPEGGWMEEPIQSGFSWGGEYGNLWLKGEYTVPEALAGKSLFLIPHTDAVETLLFLSGKPDSLFNSKGDYLGIMHSAQQITPSAVTGTVHSIALECYAGHFCIGCGTYQGYGNEKAPEGACRRVFRGVDICTLDKNIWQFVFDLSAVLQMSKLPRDNYLSSRATATLDEVCRVIVQYPNLATENEIQEGIAKAISLMAPLLEKKGFDQSRGFVGIVGHSHMDTAWLWPVDETIRKCARTYANVLKLMELYPEYRFTQSPLLHTEWMRLYYPDIFEGIRRRVAEGRYDITGGVWVECDCNITSGESMARQFLYGQQYAREHFGITCDCFWLPDTFGYNASIPQIMQESEVRYFYTTKMGWNDLNDFPLSSFRWRGLDGSEVLVHLHRIDVCPDVATVSAAAAHVKNKQNTEMELLPFGHGDGGGGPTPAMLERARRVNDLPGLPEVRYCSTGEYMHRLEKTAKKLPLYDGELYLELHRGTLTQMHEIKRSNRRLEFALHDLDYLNVLAGRGNGDADRLYKVLLLNQFHDILPGTTYTGVTQKAVSENDAAIEEAKALTCSAATILLQQEDGGFTVFNPTSFPITEKTAFSLPCAAHLSLKDGTLGQRYTDLNGEDRILLSGIAIPAFGKVCLRGAEASIDHSHRFPFIFSGNTLETPFYRVVFDDDGAIASLVHLESGRELRREGCAPLNSFFTGEDVPSYYDNWDIDLETIHKQKRQKGLIYQEVVAIGPHGFRLRQERRIAKASTMQQDIVFYATDPRIDFETRIHWQDRHQLLKTAFGLDLRSGTAKNEIQFGHIDRATTQNNSLEAAKFEVCQYKWTDISESRFGVALLNDCKYGISFQDCDLRLTLQRGGTHPDTTGDAGVHHCTYSLLPHMGAFSVPTVAGPAYHLNNPPVAFPGITEDLRPYLSLDADNVICEAIKPAYKEKDAVVLRLYEAERCRTVCRLTLPKGTQKVYRTNILEDVQEKRALPIENGQVTLNLRPFEIATLLLKF